MNLCCSPQCKYRIILSRKTRSGLSIHLPSLICIRHFCNRKNVITRKESYELIERHQISASGKSKQVPIGRQPQTSANQQKPPQQETQQIVGPQTRSKQKGNPKYLKESQVNDIQHQLHHGAHNYYGNSQQQGYQGQSKQDSGSYGSGSYNEIVEIEHHPPQQKPQKETGKQSAKNQRNQPQSNSRNFEGSSSDSLHSNNVIRKTITKTYYYGPSKGPKNQQRGNRGYGSGSPSESMKSNNDIITTKTYHYNSSGNQQRSNEQSRNQQQSKQGKQGKQSKSKINTIYDSPTESIASNNGEIVTTKTHHYSSRPGHQQRSNQQSRYQQQRNEFQSSSRGNAGYVDSPSESIRSNHGKSVANQQRSHQVRSQASSFTAQTPLTGIRADGPRQQRAGSFPHGRHGNQQLQSSNHSHSSTQTAQQDALESKKLKK